MSVTPASPPRRVVACPGNLRAKARLPGSKSITNRMYVLASLAQGVSAIRDPLRSDDTDGLLKALEELGTIVRPEGNVMGIDGNNGRYPKGGEVNLGAGGTPTRFMIAAATRARLPVIVDGNARMRERPVAEGVELLRAIGATIDFIKDDGHIPVRISPTEELKGGRVEVGRTASSQFISALMLLAPWCKEGLEVCFTGPPTSETYLELTARCLRKIGVQVDIDRNETEITHIGIPTQEVKSFDMKIEGDASSAMYPAALGAMLPSSQIDILGLPAGSSQPDLAAVKVLAQTGASVEVLQDRVVVTSAETLEGIDVDCSLFPDAAVMFGALAVRCTGQTRLRGLETLRVKETDRVHALANELRAFGCTVKEGEAELVIDPGEDSGEEVLVRTYDDHRMAMAFAILGAVRGNVLIENSDCATKSYPNFWDELSSLTANKETGDTA